jgi:hypothetical protein
MAWRDPVDGCIVPYRLHLPEGTGPFPLAIVLHPGEATIRHAWPDVPAPWLAAAQAAGVAVLGMWPAGDTRWRGVAPRRLRAILAQLDPQRIDRQRGLVLAIGQPADPPFAIHAPDQAEDPAWWRTAPGPALPPQPITDWGQRPFTVIIGTAEHRHAADGNRALAESLSQAWQRHAGVAPPLVDDGAPPPANHDLVLVGNPRSNRVLAALVTQGLHLSTTWDHRSVQAGGRTLLRATRPSIVERVTLADGRLVLVLDGGVPDWGPDLPLQGCSGLLIRRDSGRQH